MVHGNDDYTFGISNFFIGVESKMWLKYKLKLHN